MLSPGAQNDNAPVAITRDGGVVATVGLRGVEPLTSRLSGVRSNHLSYRPGARPCKTRRRSTRAA